MSLHMLRTPLLGRPHTHQRLPARAAFIGDISPAADPGRYVEAVAHLHCLFRDELASEGAEGCPPPPLIINTPGWVKVSFRACAL